MKVPLIILFLFLSPEVHATELVIGRFSSGDLSGWSDKIFTGKTSYTLVQEEGRSVLQAKSRRSASGLLKKIDLSPKQYPLLRWTWKVEHPLKKEDITKKSGDDFAARVYVVFPRTFFWQTRAINYVWAARMALNSSMPSPYTSNAMVVAVESGGEKVGTWVREERNIFEDYRHLFGEEPPLLGAVAVMTDTDDTGDEVTAWYGNISLSTR